MSISGGCLPLYTPRHIRNIVNQQRFSQLTNKFVLDFMKFFSSYNGPLMTFCYGRFRNLNVSSFWWHFSRAVCLEDLVLWCSYIKVSLQIDQLLKYKHQNYQTASQDPSVVTTFVFSLFFFYRPFLIILGLLLRIDLCRVKVKFCLLIRGGYLVKLTPLIV